jgi:hypothetical protein
MYRISNPAPVAYQNALIKLNARKTKKATPSRGLLGPIKPRSNEKTANSAGPFERSVEYLSVIKQKREEIKNNV